MSVLDGLERVGENLALLHDGVSEWLCVYCLCGAALWLMARQWKSPRQWRRSAIFGVAVAALPLLWRLWLPENSSSRYIILLNIPAAFGAAYAVAVLPGILTRMSAVPVKLKRWIFILAAAVPLVFAAAYLCRYNRYSDYPAQIGEAIRLDAQNYAGERVCLLGDSNIHRIQYESGIADCALLAGLDGAFCRTPEQYRRAIWAFQGTPGIYYAVIKEKKPEERLTAEFLGLAPDEWVSLQDFYTSNRKKERYRLYRYTAKRMRWDKLDKAAAASPENLISGGDFEDLSRCSGRMLSRELPLRRLAPGDLPEAGEFAVVEPGINGRAALCGAEGGLFVCQVVRGGGRYAFSFNIACEASAKLFIRLLPQNKAGERIADIGHALLDVPSRREFSFHSTIDLSSLPETARFFIVFSTLRGRVLMDDFELVELK